MASQQSPAQLPLSQLRAAPGWAGPEGSPWRGLPAMGSQRDVPLDRPPHICGQAYHVVVDHLLQTVSKPLQTFLGEAGREDPLLRWHGCAPRVAGTPSPTGLRASRPCSPAQMPTGSQARGCLPVPTPV